MERGPADEDFFSKPVHLRDVIRGLLRRRGLVDTSAASELNQLLKTMVPPELSSRCRVRKISDGVIDIAVSGNAVMEQLRGYYSHEVLTEFQNRKPELQIRSVKFSKDRTSGSSRKSER
ncbi:MAG: DUF721 domain-containing protein [Planctomyces sp.]|nr:DUF721 domain-containing protein [Planctomyces sp.]